MTDSYQVPAEQVVFEETIKRSRFITVIDRINNSADVKPWLAKQRLAYPDARHYCWAFIADKPGSTMHMGASDDGEPSGSAGRPMLACLQGSGIGYLVAVTIRYSGGVKLGVGGLVRAYGGGVKQALARLKTESVRVLAYADIVVDYDDVKTVQHLFKQFDAELLSQDYGHQVKLRFGLTPKDCGGFELELTNLTQGRVSVTFDDEQ
ncbi:YigZ family protein [Paraferrimonas sp. SM1919]|uniref:YigZ family protein n=1 Tax=Paraferrimonas sp. SM1919 TaxID=2662263 RepID=UPI0013D0052C|nr:YigZ family protein [Paraferrimonas sp. SM1919]